MIHIAALKRKMMQIRALQPSNPIAYPIGITRKPSPKDAHIAKLAVLVVLSPYPCSWAIEKKRAYIAERKNPEVMTPRYATTAKYPSHWMTNTMKVLPTKNLSKTLSLCSTVPPMQSKMSLAIVLTIQKMEASRLACFAVATPALQAQVGIHPAQPTSSAIYKKNSKQIHISAFLGNQKCFILLIESYSSVRQLSGVSSKAIGIKQINIATPRARIAYSSQKITTAGPMSPPTPKKRLRSWIQQSSLSSQNIQKMQRLLTIFIMQQVLPATSIVIAKFKNPKSSELTTNADPHIMMSIARRR